MSVGLPKMAAWSNWPQNFLSIYFFPLKLMLRSLLNPYPQYSFFTQVFIQPKTIRGRICGAKGKERVTPHASCYSLPLHILIPMPLCSITNYPQNLTASNNHFFMSTNFVVRNSVRTVKIAYVCSVISRISAGKTLLPKVTQQLGMETSGGSFTHISGG